MQKEEIVYYLNTLLNSYEGFIQFGANYDAKVALVLDALSESIEDTAELVQETLYNSLMPSQENLAFIARDSFI